MTCGLLPRPAYTCPLKLQGSSIYFIIIKSHGRASQIQMCRSNCCCLRGLFHYVYALTFTAGINYKAYFNKDAAGAIVQVRHSSTSHSDAVGLRSSGMPGIHANCDSGIPYWLAMAGAALAHAPTHQCSGNSSYRTHTWLHHYHLVTTGHIKFEQLTAYGTLFDLKSHA